MVSLCSCSWPCFLFVSATSQSFRYKILPFFLSCPRTNNTLYPSFIKNHFLPRTKKAFTTWPLHCSCSPPPCREAIHIRVLYNLFHHYTQTNSTSNQKRNIQSFIPEKLSNKFSEVYSFLSNEVERQFSSIPFYQKKERKEIKIGTCKINKVTYH